MLDKSKRSKIASFVACCQKAKAEGIQIFRPVLGEAGPYEVKAFVEPPREDSDWGLSGCLDGFGGVHGL